MAELYKGECVCGKVFEFKMDVVDPCCSKCFRHIDIQWRLCACGEPAQRNSFRCRVCAHQAKVARDAAYEPKPTEVSR